MSRYLRLSYSCIAILVVLCFLCQELGAAEGGSGQASLSKEGIPDPPPIPAALNNGAPYEARLAGLLQRTKNKEQNTEELWQSLHEIRGAAFEARRYDVGEQYAREIVKMWPNYSPGFSSLSVYLGKQGKYEEAEKAALEALRLDSKNSHATLVLASWEWHLGKRKKALETFQSVPVPPDQNEQRTYFGCRACFYASKGDETEVEAAIRKCLDLKDDKTFFARDIIFDPYRAKLWFVGLVGQTINGNSDKQIQGSAKDTSDQEFVKIGSRVSAFLDGTGIGGLDLKGCWTPGTVIEVLGNRKYKIKLDAAFNGQDRVDLPESRIRVVSAPPDSPPSAPKE